MSTTEVPAAPRLLPPYSPERPHTAPQQWHACLTVNLTAHYHLAAALTPAMTTAQWGRIIGSILATGVRVWRNENVR